MPGGRPCNTERLKLYKLSDIMQAALQFQSTASVFQLTFTHSLADSFIPCVRSPLLSFSLSFFLALPLFLSPSRVRLLLSLRSHDFHFSQLREVLLFFARLVLSPCGLPSRWAASGKSTEKAVFIFIHVVLSRRIIAHGSLRGGDFIVAYKESAPLSKRFPGAPFDGSGSGRELPRVPFIA